VKRLARRVLTVALALLLALVAPPARAANPCAGGGQPLDDDGIGGTGLRPQPGDDDGIGGTGARPAPEDDDGIGGTGISVGDTGVIGTITGFASICVGEVEIHYDDATPVDIDGTPAGAAELAVGQVVEVVAAGTGEQLVARAIAVRHVVVGPVSELDLESGEAVVAGQTVLLPDDVAAGVVAPGAAVRVSGMRRDDGVVVASRVTRAQAGDTVDVTGPLVELDSGALALGGAEIVVDGQADVPVGDEVRVVGRWAGDAIVATTLAALPRVPFEGRVARVDIEGFARRVDGGLQVGPYLVDIGDRQAEIDSGVRLRVEGLVRNEVVEVERVTVVAGPPPRPDRADPNRRGPHAPLDGTKSGAGHPGHLGPPPAPGHDGFGGGPPHARHGAPPPRALPPPAPRAEGSGPRPDRAANDRPADAGRPGFADRPNPVEPSERPPVPDRFEIPRAPDRSERPPLPEHANLPQRPERGERPQRPEPPAPPERPERPPRPDVVVRPEIPDRPAPPERPERPHRLERPPARP